MSCWHRQADSSDLLQRREQNFELRRHSRRWSSRQYVFPIFFFLLNHPSVYTSVPFKHSLRFPFQGECQTKMLIPNFSAAILKLPDDCGPGTYSVAHSLFVSENQTFPFEHAAASNETVLDLELSYDFALVKRDAGDVYIRVDYSNLPGYWNAVVDSAGEAKKRSTSSRIDKRFFSPQAPSWKTSMFVRFLSTTSVDHR